MERQMQWLNSHAKRKRLVNEQGTGKVIEWPIIINIKKIKIRKIPSGFTVISNKQKILICGTPALPAVLLRLQQCF